jgi:toxin FitB
MTTERGVLIDTNVISELVRESPNTVVMKWLAQQAPDSVYLSCVSLGELVHGIARLAAGARRDRLQIWLQVDVKNQFAGRLLAFGEREAVAWGYLKASTEKHGRPRGAIDLQLAATAQVAGLKLATRNVRDFEGLALPLVDPWSER